MFAGAAGYRDDTHNYKPHSARLGGQEERQTARRKKEEEVRNGTMTHTYIGYQHMRYLTCSHDKYG